MKIAQLSSCYTKRQIGKKNKTIKHSDKSERTSPFCRRMMETELEIWYVEATWYSSQDLKAFTPSLGFDF